MRKLVFGLIALAVGLGAGALIGWYVWPITTPPAQPDQLRQDWKDEVVWMAAQAYAYDHDLEAALTRLSPLGAEDVGALGNGLGGHTCYRNRSALRRFDAG